MSYIDYDAYYDISQEDLKEEYHIVLDGLLDKIVENKLKDKIEDINILRKKQASYTQEREKLNKIIGEKDKEIRELKNKIAIREEEYTKEKKKYTQTLFNDIFKDFIKVTGNSYIRKRIYYITSSISHCQCPCCNDNRYIIKEIDGEKAKIACKICDEGKDRISYRFYECNTSDTYRFGFSTTLTPCIFIDKPFDHITLSLSDAYFDKDECVAVVEKRNKENREKALKEYQDRTEKLNSKKAMKG